MKKPSSSFIIAFLILVAFVIWLGVRFFPMLAPQPSPAISPVNSVATSTGILSHGKLTDKIKLPILTLKQDQAQAKAKGASCYDIAYEDRAIAPTNQPLSAALQELGTINGVFFDRVELQGTIAVIYLKGGITQNDHCGVDLIRQKINKAAFQFDDVNVTKIILNGQSVKSVD
ncbi:MAG: hypothetical protein Q7N87_02145 [Candidatus Uhrbacteria bacterium]|nr:hypothetical protein [Candidatus Uhrbacteria bacterium]